MKLTKTKQIESIDGIDFDATYFSCGYEKRCSFIYEKLNFNLRENNILHFKKENRLNCGENEKLFKINPLNKFIEFDGEIEMEIFNSLKSYIDIANKPEINIFIDYSSMTKIWFSAFLNYFKYRFESTEIKKVNLIYAYSHSLYTPPTSENKSGISVNPINGFCNISIPDKPTALIIGLGYDKNMATGLSQYLDADSYLFYSDESYAIEYSKAVKFENKTLLNEVKQENIYEYPILDITSTELILHNVLTDLMQTNRVVLAPCGPKIFSLICLIESIKLDNVDVWRISSSKNNEVIDKIAEGKISLYKVTFEKD